MRLLQICQKPPIPATDGGCLASLQLSQCLLGVAKELKVICLATSKHPFLRNQIPDEYAKRTSIEAIEISTRITPTVLLKAVFGRMSIQKCRFFKKKARKFLNQHLTLNSYDAIIFDGLMAAFYLPDCKTKFNVNTIYRSHNIEYQIFADSSFSRFSSFMRPIINLQSRRLKMEEATTWKISKKIWSISEDDSAIISQEIREPKKITHIPFSIDTPKTVRKAESNTIFHLGAMNWWPNQEGIRWFVAFVWPKIIAQNPSAKLHLGGFDISNIKNEFEDKNIVVHEVVTDADEFFARHEIMIIPLLSGSGIRIKLIQALAHGKVIVSTNKGVAGVPGISGEHFIACSSDEEMAEAILDLMKNEEKKRKLSMGAFELYRKLYTPESVSQLLIRNLENLKGVGK